MTGQEREALEKADEVLGTCRPWTLTAKDRERWNDARLAIRAALARGTIECRDGWRLYLLLALFDRRGGSALDGLVQLAREGYERSGSEMNEDDAWAPFDAQWNALSSSERLGLVAAREEPATRVETWMVDYEHEEGEPQHAVLSWLDDEATDLPEVGTQLVRKSDYDALLTGPASYEGVTRMLREVQEERDELRSRAVKAEQAMDGLGVRLNDAEADRERAEEKIDYKGLTPFYRENRRQEARKSGPLMVETEVVEVVRDTEQEQER